MANDQASPDGLTLRDVMMHMQKGFSDIRTEMRAGFKEMRDGFSRQDKRMDDLTHEVRAEAAASDDTKEQVFDLTNRVVKIEKKLAVR